MHLRFVKLETLLNDPFKANTPEIWNMFSTSQHKCMPKLILIEHARS